MTNLAKLASVVAVALASVTTQGVAEPAAATHSPATSDSIVLQAPAASEINIEVLAPKEKAKVINQAIPTMVKAYFSEYPILAEIAFCESTLRQYDAHGNVLRGKVDRNDVGLMQINERYHAEQAKKLGIDIYTVEGNMEYAVWLYEKQGSQPWSASSPCWGNA